MNITGVDFAYVPTTDLDRAVDFYGNVLGLEESARYGQMPGVEFETATADILRANSKRLNATGVQKYRLWLYEAIRSDMPMDRFTRELLTSKGSVYENPAANYWRVRAVDVQNAFAEDTAQVFLGIRIQCAKCHNHPFERWTQDNYYGISASFARAGSIRSARCSDSSRARWFTWTPPSGNPSARGAPTPSRRRFQVGALPNSPPASSAPLTRTVPVR